ncbi:protein ROOT INITIATION DEFECTIVE 3 [Beta vulgaris subsp. vulgaris]|uniref:protein ROOT INITIATION DEFECTIVE 3 n=1 Tax=Beta vulgaris subsp. vulgaris TaxID=3555 RepID=UPI002037000C|nr:protein ROOT INITIATION DEFECTIVE 3 [Beta vulgaris subsp. vulgaris]
MEVVMASSSTDGGVGCWDLQTGVEQLRYKSCLSPPHGLVSVGGRFFASAQLRQFSTFGSILYWSWHKPQPEVKSFPAEPIKPLVSNREGTYLIGGGASGDVIVWEVFTGRLLKKWHAHYGAVTCLALSDDESLLISGAEDGGVRVWSLFMMFDDARRKEARHDYVHSFRDHTLRVTDVKSGHGGSNAIIISASEDQTCKVWSLATGRLLRNIVFSSVIDAIAIDVGEYAFYAGGRDGKIYIAELNALTRCSTDYGKHILGFLTDSSRAVTSLAFCADGISLVSGSEDGKIRIWDTRTRNIVRMFRHAKGPVTNILVTRLSESVLKSQATVGRRTLFMPPSLEKYANSSEELVGIKAFLGSDNSSNPVGVSYLTEQVLNKQIQEIQEQGSATAAEMEVERLKQENKRAMQMVQQWKNMYDNLHQFCVNELVDDSQAKLSNIRSS